MSSDLGPVHDVVGSSSGARWFDDGHRRLARRQPCGSQLEKSQARWKNKHRRTTR